MTKLCKCGHKTTEHHYRSGGVRGYGIGSYSPEPVECNKCKCKLFRSEKCVCTKITDSCTLGNNVIVCRCRWECVGFDGRKLGYGNCTPEKCACDQVPHNKNCNGCMTCS
jgi:hypothetical protein